MYKVFIDHKPIIFTEKESYSQNNLFIQYTAPEDTWNEINSSLHLIDIDNPMIVRCMNPAEVFELMFKDFQKITAAGGLVKNDDTFLTIKRKGLWDIPKGKMEKGEEYRSTAIREVEEECGIEGPKILSDLIVTYHTYVEKGVDILKTTYWYLMNYNGTEQLVPQTNEGITEVKWMTEDELKGMRGHTYGSINEVIDVYFRDH